MDCGIYGFAGVRIYVDVAEGGKIGRVRKGGEWAGTGRWGGGGVKGWATNRFPGGKGGGQTNSGRSIVKEVTRRAPDER